MTRDWSGKIAGSTYANLGDKSTVYDGITNLNTRYLVACVEF